ncbi:MAG: M20/M25/M40 family metallo-hydrolase [Phycisphaerales bacterium]|nr:M20/M25/M40 family metallo-hydrolase [Phycisphaerales bacterium]
MGTSTSTAAEHVDTSAAEKRLLKYLAIDGVSGEEKAIAEAVATDLRDLGVPATAIRHDSVNERIPLPTQTGNLIVDLPGTTNGPRLVFATHLDTVPLCRGAEPKKDGDRVVPKGKTALGGDNRTGCAVLATLAETLLKHKLPHPPITLLFTVREESGLQGVRYLDPKDLGGGAMCFNVDSKLASELITGAVGAQSFDVHIEGKASHAGVAPEKGISATMVAAVALAALRRDGWFGKVQKAEGRGTSNIGIFGGKDGTSAGNATNVVTDYVYLRGEARSPDDAFAATITKAYEKAFAQAASEVLDDAGGRATVKFEGRAEYPSFRLGEDAPAVVHAKRAVESIGLKPACLFSNGGLDANWLVKYGLPTVTIGAGQYDIHTVNEYVHLPEYFQGCRLAVALATQGNS